MADLAENIRAFLLSKVAITAIVGPYGVHQSTIPQERELPYVWFRRGSRRSEPTLDAAVGQESDEQWFDVECISDDLEVSQALASAVRAELDNYRGGFGTATVAGVFVDDQSDDYVARGTMGETELEVAALSVRIITQ